MPDRLTAQLHAHRCRIKAAWVMRLRELPPKTALASADILVHRMDETLLQLATLLRQTSGEDALPPRTPLREKLQAGCACGLSPLLDFFVTGDAAIGEILDELPVDQQALLGQAWHALAQSEIETLCSACCRVPGKCPCGYRASLAQADCAVTRLR